jgi:hypothetical protein
MTDNRVTQVSPRFASANPPAQVTQVTVEHWVTTATITGQALVTQVALEQWVPAVLPAIELAGNLERPAPTASSSNMGWGITAGLTPLPRSSRRTLLSSPPQPCWRTPTIVLPPTSTFTSIWSTLAAG